MKQFLAAAAVACLATSASAATTTLDFSTVGGCTGGPGVAFDVGSNICSPYPDSPDEVGNPIMGFYSSGLTQIRANFSSLVSFVSVDLGDFDQDPDRIFLALYDSADNLLSYVNFNRPADSYEMNTLSAYGTNVAYALFGTDADDQGYIAADNFTFTTASVPVPAGGVLLLAGLGGLAALRKRRA